MGKYISKLLYIFILAIILNLNTFATIGVAKAEDKEDTEESTEDKSESKSCEREVELKKKDGNYYLDDTLIVNKVYPLSKDYNPGASDELKSSIDKMIEDAKKEDLDIGIAGDASLYGFRSYSTQETLYNDYVDRDGEKEANKYSAKPGHSEHQSGLTVDIKDNKDSSTDLKESFGETSAGKWVEENAHKYGLIIRYPKGKEDVHGYIYEPWHLRHVGEDIAKTVKENSITLEEYFGINGDKEPRKEGKIKVNDYCDDGSSKEGTSGGKSEETEKGNIGSGRGEYTGNLEYDPFEDGGVVNNSTGIKDGNSGTIHSQETYVVSQWVDIIVNIILIVLMVILATYMVFVAVIIMLISFTNSYISENKIVRALVGGKFIDKMVGNGVKSVFWDILLRFMLGSFVLIVAITGMVNGLQFILIEAVKKAFIAIGL